MLATAKHETGHTFEPVTERGDRAYFNKYDPVLANTPKRKQIAIDMENTKEGDGYKYRGRGYVQLTWRKNYRKSGEYLNKDLVKNPELALDQKNATKIMIYGMETGMFTGKRMSNYINDNKKDYLNARRIINGTDQALRIANYASKLEECLRWL
ncbi:calcium-binding protein [Rodentibacter ratti]|uniref:Calcium-binding protein n=2 Tax=Rodentibacter ratti TaxID=1906745 RepID=A0A1V3KZM6_9PAST|nr:calcium-binding protein [Rodentibacter ratti]